MKLHTFTIEKGFSKKRFLASFSSIFFFVIGAILVTPSFSWAEEPLTKEQWLKKHISIQNRMTLRYRSESGEKDFDFYDHWYIRGRNLYSGRLDGYFSGRIQKDLDGRSNSLAEDLFIGVEDRKSDWNDQIYQLYGDLHDKNNRFGLRLGRQYIEDADSIHIDGALLRLFKEDSIKLQLFYGQPVNYYSGSTDEWTAGASISGRPWSANHSRLTYTHYKDKNVDQKDDFFALDVWQQFGQQFRSHARVSILDGDYQTGSADLRYYRPTGNFDAYVAIQHLGRLDPGIP